MRSYIEALNDGAWKDPEVAPSFLKVTQDETDRMIRMINDLLSLSRMDSGTVKLDFELVNLNELFNYILNRFDMMLKKTTTTLVKPRARITRSSVISRNAICGLKSTPTSSFRWSTTL